MLCPVPGQQVGDALVVIIIAAALVAGTYDVAASVP
jgi:hypothetical protein